MSKQSDLKPFVGRNIASLQIARIETWPDDLDVHIHCTAKANRKAIQVIEATAGLEQEQHSATLEKPHSDIPQLFDWPNVTGWRVISCLGSSVRPEQESVCANIRGELAHPHVNLGRPIIQDDSLERRQSETPQQERSEEHTSELQSRLHL